MMGRETPYLRLSSFYFFYFASVGVLVPYWSVYLQSEGFTPAQIGELIAVTMATKVFAPYLWGWVADHTGRRLSIIRWATFFAALAFSGVFLDKSYFNLVLILGIYSIFWHAALPQFEVITLTLLGSERDRYSHIRLWGSVGFILSVVGLGYWFELLGVAGLPLIFLIMLIGIWVSTLSFSSVPDSGNVHQAISVGAALRRPEVIAFLLACFLMQGSHGPYYAFFSIYLEEHGYLPTQIGWLWALGVAAEIGVFLIFYRWLRAFGAIRLFQISIIITAFRWVLLAFFVENVSVLLFAQVLHAASYGLFHAAAIELVNHFFPGRLQGRGQALYSSVSFGLGNAVGSFVSGRLWTMLSPEWTYLLASGMATLGFFVALFFIRPLSE
jgi:PPP family 3-phenylpropionic acid transporter